MDTSQPRDRPLPAGQAADAFPEPIVRAGHNCWRIERAREASVVIDAADYYHYIREAMEAAQDLILVVGWDFDTRILLEPDQADSAETLGAFFLRLAKADPKRRIDILKWGFRARRQFLNPRSAWMLWRWHRTEAIDFRFDRAHPPGCSHHQKIVIIDDVLAVCGGIDISLGRWDTSEHRDDNPARRLPGGALASPWHDVTMVMSGAPAKALSELGRERWQTATSASLAAPTNPADDVWPPDLPVQFRDVDIALARTRAAWGDLGDVREIEALWLDMIAAAKRFIYIENQYFTSGKIAAAIAARLQEDNPPDIVLVAPRTAEGWLEQRAMDAARVRLARSIGKIDVNDRFRVYVPVTRNRADIYVHAKVCIVDDRLLRVGSANLNNRSMGLDSECDIAVDTALPANRHVGPVIAQLRARLIAEHLDVTPEAFEETFARTGSLVDAIEALRGDGKSLDLLDLEKPGPLDRFIADHELLDPTSADGFFEPLGRRGLRRSWMRGKALVNLRERFRWRPSWSKKR